MSKHVTQKWHTNRWASNLRGTRSHLLVEGYSNMGAVAACDKKGIVLDTSKPLPRLACVSCTRLAGVSK